MKILDLPSVIPGHKANVVRSSHEDPHKILFGSLLEAIVATDAIRNYITESQKNV